MRKILLLIVVAGCFYAASCKKSTESEQFKLLTGPVWASDSLLANGIDASGPDGILKNFLGDAKFKTNGTGNFGKYTGTWRFAFNETEIVISSDSLQIPISTKIVELTTSSLKVTTNYPNPLIPTAPIYIRMTFKAK